MYERELHGGSPGQAVIGWVAGETVPTGWSVPAVRVRNASSSEVGRISRSEKATFAVTSSRTSWSASVVSRWVRPSLALDADHAGQRRQLGRRPG